MTGRSGPITLIQLGVPRVIAKATSREQGLVLKHSERRWYFPSMTWHCVPLINYPGASTQALCSAPTSPLTALAFRSCSRKRESGVCEFVCLCFYI